VARPAYERVGEALKTAYKKAGLRQEDLAAALDVDQGTVSRWSRGVQRIELEYFPRIDELCGRPRGYLLRLAGYVDDLDALDTVQAIRSDPRLDDQGRTTLEHLYLVLTSPAAQTAGASGTAAAPAR